MNPVLIALLAFIGGCVFLGLVVFLVLLYRAFSGLRQTLEINSMHIENLAERIPEMLGQWNELAGKMINSSEMCAVKMVSSQELATAATRDQAAVSNKASAVFAEMAEQVKLLIKSFNTFNSMVWKEPSAEPERAASLPSTPRSRQEEGTFIGYDETTAAAEEMTAEALKHGIVLRESELFRPEKSQMVGGDDPKLKQPDSRGPVPPAQDSPGASGGNSEAG